MTTEETIKAWKNDQYRHTLTSAQRAALPVHPAGVVELDEALLTEVTGADASSYYLACTLWLICGPRLTVGYNTEGCCPMTIY